MSRAQTTTEFPLNTYNLNEDLVKHILPLLYFSTHCYLLPRS